MCHKHTVHQTQKNAQWSTNPEDHNDIWRASYTLTPEELRKSVLLFPQNPPRRRWEVAHAMRQPVQRDGNKPFCGGGGGERKKKSLRLLAAHTNVLRSNLSGVLFRFLLQQRCSVSVSDGLNEGLVSWATGSRSTRPGVCVYYQSALVSTAGYIQRSPSSLLPQPPPLTHKRPHLQEWTPPTHTRLPQNLSSITPQVLHTYATVHTHSQHTALAYIQFIMLWTCICTRVYKLIPNSLHLRDHTDKVYMCIHILCTYTHATQECVSTHSYTGRNACTYTHTH